MKLRVIKWSGKGFSLIKVVDLATIFQRPHIAFQRPDIEVEVLIANERKGDMLADGGWTTHAVLLTVNFESDTHILEAHRVLGHNWVIGEPNLSIFSDREIGIFIAEALLAGVESEQV